MGKISKKNSWNWFHEKKYLPVLALRLHDMVTDMALLSTILGLVGACGNVAGSGVLWNMMFGFLGFSTDSEADHEVSPDSALAVQV